MPEKITIETKIEEAFRNLLRGYNVPLSAHLNSVAEQIDLPATKARLNCHHIHLGSNGIPKVKELVDFLVYTVADYALPKLEHDRAKALDEENNSTAAVSELHKRASRLFVNSETSGEGGEILLYALIQDKLKIPQLLSKMALKTNSNMPVHGADGIHATIDPQTGDLIFYWAESKLHETIESAIKDCLATIMPFLYEPPETPGRPRRERDLELVRADLSKLNSEVLETALLDYLNPQHPKFNKVNFRGACLVGFDSEKYPDLPNQISTNQLAALLKQELETQWKTLVADEITDRKPLDTFQLEVFLIPMPDVDDFRTRFNKALKE